MKEQEIEGDSDYAFGDKINEQVCLLDFEANDLELHESVIILLWNKNPFLAKSTFQF